MAVAVIELIPIPPTYPNGFCPQAVATLAAAGVTMAMAGSLKGTSTSAANQLDSRANELQKILDTYDQYHGGKGNYDQYAQNDRRSQTGGISQQQTTFGDQGGTNVLNTDGPGGSSLEAPLGCIDSKGEFQDSCSCRQDNSCMKFTGPSFKLSGTKANRAAQAAQFRDLNANTGFGSMAKNFNAVANGKLGLGAWANKAARASRRRIAYAKKKLKEHNKRMKSAGKAELKFDSAYVSKYIKDNVSPDVIAKFENDPRLKGAEKAMQEQTEQANKSVGKVYQKVTSWKKPLAFKKKPFTMDFLKDVAKDQMSPEELAKLIGKNVDEKDLKATQEALDQMMEDSTKKGQRASGDWGPGVNQDADKSIFNILSKRYRRMIPRLKGKRR
jgi:hypothetical protein